MVDNDLEIDQANLPVQQFRTDKCKYNINIEHYSIHTHRLYDFWDVFFLLR